MVMGLPVITLSWPRLKFYPCFPELQARQLPHISQGYRLTGYLISQRVIDSPVTSVSQGFGLTCYRMSYRVIDSPVTACLAWSKFNSITKVEKSLRSINWWNLKRRDIGIADQCLQFTKYMIG